ncbi:MAG: endonuclease/exonuclease/phosphatase family protein [Patescibacteria group bacterium]
MTIISLNTWGGRASKENLLAFFEAHKDVDIFCLQEIWSAPYESLKDKIDQTKVMTNGMQEISALLSNHQMYFRPHVLDDYGLMILVKKDLPVLKEGEIFVHHYKGYVPKDDIGTHARNVHYVTIETPHGNRTIMNFHGLWNGQGKSDSPDRLAQSERIMEFIQTINNPIVLCGDFNLSPETESLKKLESLGLRNLIRENNITSTRTSFYTKPEKFADYALVSPEIHVQNFQVLPEEVSDHSALYLQFT